MRVETGVAACFRADYDLSTMSAHSPFPWRNLIGAATLLGALGGTFVWALPGALAQEVTKGEAAAKKAPPAAKGKPQYESIPTGGLKDPADWKLKKTSLIAEGKVAEGEAGQADDTVFTNHYKLLITEMTQPANRPTVHLKRVELRKDLNAFGRSPDKSLHTKLRDMLAKSLLPKVFRGDYSPEARANALIAYGDLNADEGDIGGAGSVPYPAALPGLIAVLKNQDPKIKYPTYLQSVALVGINRHLMSAKGTVPADQRKEIAQVMASWLRKPPSDGLSVDVQHFFRRRAVDVLRTIAAKGPEANTPEVASSLQQFAADEDAPLDDRCEAIRMLGMLDKKSFPEKNVPVVARTIALLAAEVGRQTAALPPPVVPAEVEAKPEDAAAADAPAEEAPPADETNADTPAAPVAAAPPAVPAAADEAAEKPIAKSGKTLLPEMQTYFLYCLRLGLGGAPAGRGLASAATADNKQLLVDLTAKIDEMIEVVKKKKKDDRLNEGEIRKLRDLATGLEAIIGHPPATAEGTAEQARVP